VLDSQVGGDPNSRKIEKVVLWGILAQSFFEHFPELDFFNSHRPEHSLAKLE
jgi:hypothetical protein